MNRREIVIGAALVQLASRASAQSEAHSEEDARFLAFLDDAFDAQVALRPQLSTLLGTRDGYDRLDDYTESARLARMNLIESQHARVRREFRRAQLSPRFQTFYDLYEFDVEAERLAHRWRWHAFPVNSTRSATGSIPAFLITAHRITSLADAEAYIARIEDARRAVSEIISDIQERARLGVLPPRFIFRPVLDEIGAVTSGAPFDNATDNAIWADFKSKLAGLSLSPEESERLRNLAAAALLGPWREGYSNARSALEAMAQTAQSNDGVWRLPDGEAYYEACVRLQTTQTLSPTRVFAVGLRQVARVREEMEEVKSRIGASGSLNAFFAEIRSAPQYQYPNTADGRAAYLEDARRFIEGSLRAAPRYFNTLPRTPLEVRAVEPFREATSPPAFYSRGAPDGSRPGTFYVNLSDMTQVLKPQVEAIAYHEGAPGHHFQISLAQEQRGLPKFRRFNQYGAYTEGWGLYAEKLGKEMGGFSDPISDFGRLSLELWRAARLVVDAGLHHERWSRERAAAYMRENTLLSDRDVELEVDRYLVAPGQAISYMIGQMRILDLRAHSQRRLRDRFDLRAFHDTVLSEGAMPLDLLETRVRARTRQ